MPLKNLQHFLIQSEDIEATKDWYVNTLGLKQGYAPDFKFPVYWLYLGGEDVIHLTHGGKSISKNRLAYVGQQSDAIEGTGVIDHVAFSATGLHQMIAHLQDRRVEFFERQVDAQGLYQLFLFDPNGIKIELNFPNAEAQGRKPGVMASDLSHEAVSAG